MCTRHFATGCVGSLSAAWAEGRSLPRNQRTFRGRPPRKVPIRSFRLPRVRGLIGAALALAGLLAARDGLCPLQPGTFRWAVEPGSLPSAAAFDGEPPPPTSYRFAEPQRLVAIGDLHGNLEATRQALKVAGAVDQAGNWAGGKLVVVQVGDLLDRGHEERPILTWLERLNVQARAAGGAVHVLNGNHETMNVGGDFHSVTPLGFQAFANFRPLSSMSSAVYSFPLQIHGRAAAFMPGAKFARLLARHPTIIVVGGTLFVHGGVLPKHVDYGIGRINSELSRWMSGGTSRPPLSAYQQDSPVWTRYYSPEDPNDESRTREMCETLEQVLASLSVDRMVIGHTVQANGINSDCSRRLYRIDVGVSGLYGGTPEVLEIENGEISVIKSGSAPGRVPRFVSLP